MNIRTALAASLLAFTPTLFAQDINALAFLTGSWAEKTERSETQEVWTAPRSDGMAAANTSLRGGKSGFEFLRIVKRDDKIIYLASPGGRQPPTEFPMKELKDNRVVFENPTHDFPTRIIYQRDGDNLLARIEGSIGGKERAMEWRFKRAP